MHQFLARLSIAFIAVSFCSLAIAQPKTDTTKGPSAGPRSSAGPKPYKEVITNKAVTDEGLFNVHKVEDKYYFEIHVWPGDPGCISNFESSVRYAEWIFWICR